MIFIIIKGWMGSKNTRGVLKRHEETGAWQKQQQQCSSDECGGTEELKELGADEESAELNETGDRWWQDWGAAAELR